MRKIYKVSRVLNETVDIIPFDKGACETCSGSCSGCNIVLQAKNLKKLQLKPGMIVQANVSTAFQEFCNFLALIIPVLSAIAGFFLAPKISAICNLELTETFKAVCVLLFLFIPGLIIFFLTRNRSELIELQITKIVQE